MRYGGHFRPSTHQEALETSESTTSKTIVVILQ